MDPTIKETHKNKKSKKSRNIIKSKGKITFNTDSDNPSDESVIVVEKKVKQPEKKSKKQLNKFKGMDLEQIQQLFKTSLSDLKKDKKTLDKALLQFNLKQIKPISEFSKEHNYLYPNYLDPQFNYKISRKKEFHDLKYDDEVKDAIKESDAICNSKFELAPHQIFIRNFLSFLTPYNSLLLYHGLGTGKTCSAISVCEEMRDYMKQMGITKRIIIVASPNVQENFKLQLFDERKLTEMNGLWNLRACTGNKFIKEINPMNMKGLTKEKIIRQAKRIINQNYLFMGYIEFSNYIARIQNKYNIEGESEEEKHQRKMNAIKKEFSNRLIVIDEVHNIRIANDSPNKKVAQNLLDMIRYTDTLKLLLLSATPMFNSYKEIIWLLNLLNVNDGRPEIEVRDIFDKEGNFKEKDGKEIGKELFIQKMNGYVSFLRGENPYSFPYRIFPSDFLVEHTIKESDFVYPKKQLNGKTIEKGIDYIDLFYNSIGEYQKYGYTIAIEELRSNLPDESAMDKGMGWQIVEVPLQTLNIVYPNSKIDTYIERGEKQEGMNTRDFIGKTGLNAIMDYDQSRKRDYEYSDLTLDKYGRVFSLEQLQKYSMKMYNMMNIIKKSDGIIIIYSQYIDGGCVPLALTLEEMGFSRHGRSNLFKTSSGEKLDVHTMKRKNELSSEELANFKPAKYIMVTGDKQLSPNNADEINASTNDENMYGEEIKVVIISKAGSEGIDFKNVRQVHIMEPWYNMSRIEQTIGRAVRFRSHCGLPFEERNVEIYLYGTYVNQNTEPIDLYIYRMAEQKAVQIGKVSRIMKEYAIDCYLNKGMNIMTYKKLNQELPIRLASGAVIQYKIGDKPYTQLCDYMDKCQYKCRPSIPRDDKTKVMLDTYNEQFIILNMDKIILKIKELFKTHYILKKSDLIQKLTQFKKYSTIQIDSALQYLIEERNEFLVDMFGRLGYLVNIEDYYMFQPVELDNNKISYDERSKPLQFKPDKISIQLEKPVSYYAKEAESKTLEPADIERITLKSVKTTDKEKSKKMKTMKSKGKIIFDDDTDGDDVEDTPSGTKASKVASKAFTRKDKIIEKIMEKYKIATTTTSVKRGVNDWYEHAGVTIQRLSSSIDINILRGFVLHHLVDILDYEDKILLIEYLLERSQRTLEESIMMEYLNEHNRVMISDDKIGYLFVNKGKLEILFVKDNKLIPTEPVIRKELARQLVSKRVDISEYNFIFGFMYEFKKQDIIIFKTKDIEAKRNKGARCDQAGKQTNINTLNKIVEGKIGDRQTFNKENTKQMRTPQICSEQEFILRYNDSIEKDGKVWFLNYEEAVLNQVESLYRK
jgi:hypothetical protein